MNKNEFVLEISKELEKKYERIKFGETNQEKENLKMDYINTFLRIWEYTKSVTLVLCYLISSEVDGIKDEKWNKSDLSKFVLSINNIFNGRAQNKEFLVLLERIIIKANRRKEVLEKLYSKIALNFQSLMKVRNVFDHSSSSLLIEKNLEELFGSSGVQKEIWKMPCLLLKEILYEINSLLINEKVMIFDDENFITIESETNYLMHKTGLICKNLLSEEYYFYKSTSRKVIKLRHVGINRYDCIYDSVSFKDKKAFLKIVELNLEIKNKRDWSEININNYVIGEKCEDIEIEITRVPKKNKIYFFEVRIKKDIQRSEGQENFVVYKDAIENKSQTVKKINISNKIKVEGIYKVEFRILTDIRNMEKEVFYKKIIIKAEEKNKGEIQLSVSYSYALIQYKKSDIIVTLENTGNIKRKINLRMQIADKEHFQILEVYEKESHLKHKNNQWKINTPILFSGYEKKKVIIEIIPYRSEEDQYQIGEISIEDEEKNILHEMSLQDTFVRKSFQPRNFYGRVNLFAKLKYALTYNEKAVNIGIEKIWIKGEAGIGKTRVAEEIEKITKKKNITCITVSYKKHSGDNHDILRELYIKLRKEFRKYEITNIKIPDNRGELEKFLDQLNNEEKIEAEILNLLINFRKDENTPKKIIFQIDDVHFARYYALKKLMDVINKCDQFFRNRMELNKKKLGELTIIFYSRTLDGLGAKITYGYNRNESYFSEHPISQNSLHKILEKNIPKVNQYKLDRINTGDDDENAKKFIQNVTEEIFVPHKMNNEMDLLTKVLALKSGGNPFILELLIENMVRSNLIIWNREEQSWQINREKLEIRTRDGETFDIAYMRVLEEFLNTLYLSEEKLNDRLLINKIEHFKGTEAEMIMHLVGMLEGVDEEELKAQGLDIHKESEIMMILKSEKEMRKEVDTEEVYMINKYSFKHHLYEEYWERYFEEEIRPLFETWNAFREKLTKREVKSEETEKWLQETTKLIEKRIASGIAEDESNLDEDDFDHEEYIDLKKTYEETVIEINSEKTISYKTLSENIFKKFKTQDELLKYMMIRKQLLNGFERRGRISASYTIRYGLYCYLSEKEGFEEIEAYYDRFVNSMVDNIHQYKYNEQFEKDMRFLVEKVLKELEGEAVDDYWAGLGYDYLAETQEVKGKYEKARELYSKTSERMKSFLKNNPENEKAYSLMGNAIQSKGEILAGTGRLVEALKTYEEAIEAYETAITLNSKNGDFHLNKGIAIKNKGEILAGMGKLVEALKTYEEAIEAYETAITLNSKKANFHTNKGIAIKSKGDILASAGRFEEAIDAYNKAIRVVTSAITLNPKDGNYHSSKGRAIASKGDILAGTGRLVEALKTYEEAIEAYETAITLNPKKAFFHTNKGIAIQSKGEILAGTGRLVEAINTYDEAIVAHETAITLNPKKAFFHTNKGIAIQSKGEILAGMGRVEEALNTYDEAIVAHETAITLNSKNANFHTNKGIAIQSKGEILAGMGRLVEALKTYEEAIVAHETAITLNPNKAECHSNKGAAIASKGEILAGTGRVEEALKSYEEAIEAYETAITLNPKKANFHSNKGNAIQRKGEILAGTGRVEEALKIYEEAIEAYETAITLNSKNANFHTNKGNAIQRKGEILAGTGRLVEALKTYEEAIEAYETAITLNPNKAECHSNKGLAIARKGDILVGTGRLVEALKTYDEAIAAHETAITLNSKDGYFHSNKGNVLNRKGLLLQQAGERKHARESIKMAIKSHQKVLELNPHDTRRYWHILRDIQALEQLIETEEEKTMITEQYLSVKEKLEAFQKAYPAIEEIKEIIGWIEQHLENEQKNEEAIHLTKKIQQILEKNSGTPCERILLLVAVTGYVTEQQLQDEELKIEAGDSTMQLLEKKTAEQDGKTIHYYMFKDKDHWQICESLLLEELRTLGGKFSNKQLEENNELSQMETAEYSRYDLIRKQLTKGFNTYKGNNIGGVRCYGRYLLVMNESVEEVTVEWFQIMQSIQENMSDVIKDDDFADQIKKMIQDSLPEIKEEKPEDLLIGFSYYTYGEMTFHKTNYAESEKNHRLAISEFEKIDTTNEKASKFIQNLVKNSYKTLSIIYKERGKLLQIIGEKEAAEKRFEKANRYSELATEL